MSSPTAESAGPRPLTAGPVDDIRHARRRARPGRWIAGAVLLVVLADLAVSLATSPRLQLDVVADYLFRELTLRGLAVTLWLTVLAMVIGVVGGTAVAVMRLSGNPVLVAVAGLYVWIFRGTPVLVQILFWGYLGALYPQIALGVPFTDLDLLRLDTNSAITGTTAAVLALGLNEIAYASEIIRGGLQAVDYGQTEAAHALGMSSRLTMRRIVLPQAMRVIVPPMGNETITMLKTTALVSVVSGADLLTNLQSVYAQNFQVIPLLVVASLWYLAVSSVLTVVQSRLERRYGRGAAGRRTAGRGVLGRRLRPDAAIRWDR